MRRVLPILAVVVLLAGIAVVAVMRISGWAGRSPSAPVAIGPVAPSEQLARLSIGGPFSLVDPQGRPVHDTSFPGRWLLVYFGYTTCPDVCPTTLQAIAGALDNLGPAADRVVPLFITVDPARDTASVMGRYVALFSPRLIGLTGTTAQIEAAEQVYRVYAARVDQPGTNGYLMDHTSFIYLIGPDGHLRSMFDRDATAATLATSIRKALG